MQKNILLISTSFEEISLYSASDYHPKGVQTSEVSHYPLGLAYLESYLEKHELQADILFLNNYDYNSCFEKVIKHIENQKPYLIGFQVFTANRVSVYRLIEHINKNYPTIKIVIGGVHATICYRQIINKYPFVTAVLGEGEISFLELTREFKNENPNLENIHGLAYYNAKTDSVKVSQTRDLIEDLDSLPFPRHEIFFKHKDRTSGCIVTSRGCPFNCSFCCLDAISRRRVRFRSARNVVDEIELMVKQFPQMNRIWIQDDTFFLDNKRVIEICDEIIKRKIKIKFTCSGRMKPISLEMLQKLELAGFQKILLGLESGDEEILKKCHKGITQEDVINAVSLISKTNLKFGIFLIVGLPGETRDTIKATARFIQKLQKIKYFELSETSILTVYPGTEVYEIAKTGGIINDDYWLSDNPAPLYTLEHSEKELIKLKQILLYHVSIQHLLFPAGLIAQFKMLPQIIKFLNKNKYLIPRIISRPLKNYLPDSIFYKIKKIFYFFNNNTNK